MTEKQQFTFTTTRGETYAVRAVSETLIIKALNKIEQTYRERGEPIDPPTYTVALPGGVSETYPHDEKSILGDPAAEAAWAAYRDARERLEVEQEERRSRMLLRGIQFEYRPGWEEEHAMVGVDVPEDPQEKWYHYLTTEVLINMDDYLAAVELVTILMYGLSSEEAVKAAMDNFRRQVRERSARAAQNARGQMEPQPDHGAGSDGESVGTDPKPVSRPRRGRSSGDAGVRNRDKQDAGL